MPAPDGPQFRNLWSAAIAEAEQPPFNLNALSDDELDDIRRAMPDGTEPTAENFIRAHRLANLPVSDIEDEEEDFAAYEDADMNPEGPNYAAEDPFPMVRDPFDRSDPEQASQAENIEAMNELWEE